MKIKSPTGDALVIKNIKMDELPVNIRNKVHDFTTAFKVAVDIDGGKNVLYLFQGHRHYPRDVHAIYPNTGAVWYSYRKTVHEAAIAALTDAWMVA